MQDLPLELPALEYVERVARANDPGITLEKCRAALGALGLTGSMALQKIGEGGRRVAGEGRRMGRGGHGAGSGVWVPLRTTMWRGAWTEGDAKKGRGTWRRHQTP